MRLVCPNCDAEYEVDDAAIPRTGRDVQCSNCGHAWFQTHPEMVDQETEDLMPDAAPVSAAEALSDELPDEVAEPDPAADLFPESAMADPADEPGSAAPEDDAVAASVAEAVAQSIARTEVAPDPVTPAAPKVVEASASTRNIDESVLAVLREEAAREVAARRAETPALETQTEMRLTPAAAAAASTVVARLKGEPEAAPATGPRPRRDLLPAIEEINSTLRASSGRPGEEEQSLVAAEAAQAARNRFGSGFITLVLIGVILLAIYVLAPVIAEKVPSLAGVLSAYVAAVDAARVWLDSQIRSLIGMLRGLEGAAQG